MGTGVSAPPAVCVQAAWGASSARMEGMKAEEGCSHRQDRVCCSWHTPQRVLLLCRKAQGRKTPGGLAACVALSCL